ncbi:MAG: shikimate 5-dehydrogenase, partial [Arenicella sp.]
MTEHKTYGLVGKSLKHSFSQSYFEKKFESIGFN